MTVQTEIDAYIASQKGQKRADLQALHDRIAAAAAGSRLWYLDGRNDQGKIVTNPNIGYGELALDYADGSSRDFYRIGISANTSGISIYVMGIADKAYLAKTFAPTLGKASVTGYCIKFKALADLDPATLDALIRFALADR